MLLALFSQPVSGSTCDATHSRRQVAAVLATSTVQLPTPLSSNIFSPLSLYPHPLTPFRDGNDCGPGTWITVLTGSKEALLLILTPSENICLGNVFRGRELPSI